MSKRRGKQPPPHHAPVGRRIRQSATPNLLELDRFSKADLDRWDGLSRDLDELQSTLYAGVEPQRQRYHDELVAAIKQVPSEPLDLDRWVRLATLRYVDTPLAATGSLTGSGGRFNVGAGVDNAVRTPWPTLYMASDHETAYREKFGMAKQDRVDGLSAEELALQPDDSYAAIQLNGHLTLVFDLGKSGALNPLSKVLRKIKLPAEATRLRRRLKIPPEQIRMIHTPARLLQELMAENWRILPAQFGIPAVSQIFARLVIDAGFEAIRFPSSKGDGDCVAVFPHCLADEASFVELADPAPAGVHPTRLDLDTADDLCGWQALPSRLRPTR